jgi:hypothetical protein
MIHDITLADPLDPMSPPETVLRLSAVGDALWVSIQKHDNDAKTDTFTTVAEQCVSLPAIREALDLIRHDIDRENQRPLERPGHNEREATIPGDRFGVMPL